MNRRPFPVIGTLPDIALRFWTGRDGDYARTASEREDRPLRRIGRSIPANLGDFEWVMRYSWPTCIPYRALVNKKEEVVKIGKREEVEMGAARSMDAGIMALD